MSRAIETFFGGTDTRPPACFVVRRKSSIPCGFCAEFVEPREARQCNTVGRVEWRAAGTTVSVCGSLDIVEATLVQPTKTLYSAHHLKLLKSNLQKAIRRGLVQAAVSTAREMMTIDSLQVVQRLAIIWIEDCVLTAEFPILVWCLAAMTKGWALTEELASVVIALAGRLAAMPIRDVHGKKRERYPVSRLREVKSQAERSLLYALQFRRDFQSLSCDKQMIDRCVSDWAGRFASGTTTELVLPDLSPDVSLDLPMTDTHWSEAAVDQHCSSLCSWVAADFQLPEALVRRAVWECSSRITTKKAWEKGRDQPDTSEGVEELWERLRVCVHRKAVWVLSRLPRASSGSDHATAAGL